jgi:hypothetical protein
MPSLQSLTFETSELQLDREEEGRKVWFTKDGDGVSLNFFDVAPDLPPDMKSVEQVQEFYVSMLQGSPTKFVEMGPRESVRRSCSIKCAELASSRLTRLGRSRVNGTQTPPNTTPPFHNTRCQS